MKRSNEFIKYIDWYHIKNFITYKKTNEKLYKWLKVIVIVAYIYQIIMNLLLIFGMKYAKQPLESSLLSNTVVATVLIAIAFFSVLFNYGLIATVYNIVSIPFEMSLMIPGLIKTAGAINIKGAFYWQYAFPMAIILIITAYMGVIAAKERYIMWRDEKLLKNALYTKFGEGYDKLTDKEIREFVNTFDPYKK